MRTRSVLGLAIAASITAGFGSGQTPPRGPEFVVNTNTTGAQEYSRVAMSPTGEFVVSWNTYPAAGPASLDIAAQRFDVSGAKQGGEFLANTFTTDTQYASDVAMDSAGDFVVVWASNGEETGTYPATGIYGQRYNSAGVAQGAEFHVNTETYDYQYAPSVARRAAGDFVVVWDSYGQDGSDYGIYGQRFNAAGTPTGLEFRVNSHTTGAQAYPNVAINSSGAFVVVWQSAAQDGSDYGVFGQRYNSAGVAQGAEFQANTYTTGAQTGARVATSTNGGFVVVWESNGQIAGAEHDIFGQRYDATGAPLGGEFLVNTTTTGNQTRPSLAMDGAGNAIVVWEKGTAIAGQIYDTAGRRVGSEFQVNDDTTATQGAPAVALDSTGNFVVTWHRGGGDGSATAVIGRRLERAASGIMKVDEPTSSVVVHEPAALAGNRVLEPGETVTVAPAWTNTFGGALALTGTASNLTGPGGGTYTILDNAADYGNIGAGGTADCQVATGNCYSMSVSGARPAAHWDATFRETLSNSVVKTWTLHVGESFTDVPTSQLFYRAIESVLHAGITTGCTATTYCPGDQVTRSQMSLFLARGVAANSVAIPTSGVVGGQPYNCVAGGHSLFTDVTPTDIFCKSVHYLASQNVTSGCSPTAYCPTPNVTRLEMSAFVARAVVAPLGGAGVPQTYGPDPVTGLSYSCNPGSPNIHFTDVPASDTFCKHVHFLWAKGIISGCGPTTYCPGDPVTRDAMARFLTNGFKVNLYGP